MVMVSSTATRPMQLLLAEKGPLPPPTHPYFKKMRENQTTPSGGGKGVYKYAPLQ